MRSIIVFGILLGLAVNAQSATTPGTILSSSASVSYTDSAGQAMPQQSSNTSNVLVVSASTVRPVAMNIKSLFLGPSTVGKTVKLVGTLVTDTNGTWLDDGSVKLEKDTSGKMVSTKLRCKVSTLFLSQAPAANQHLVITGISQTESDGTHVVIPATDTEVSSL